MRSLLIALHKYMGLTLGLLLSVIGVSGSLLVFDHAIDEAITPALQISSPIEQQQASLDAIVTAARNAVSSELTPSRIYLARHAGSSHMVRFPGKDSTHSVEVNVDPHTAQVLTVRTWSSYPTSWIYYFHHSLVAGETGHYVVGIMGFCLLFFCISGVIIWWPRKKQWRRAFSVKTNAGAYRLNYDLHKTFGFYLSIFLIISAFTGISLVFHKPVDQLIAALFPTSEYPNPTSNVNNSTSIITADAAVAIALPLFPDADIKRVYLPRSDTGTYKIVLNQPAEPWQHFGTTGVWIDQYSGAVLATWDAPNAPIGGQIQDWLFPLHNGDALGLAGRWFTFFLGLTPAFFFATGVYMWLKKRAPSRKKSSQPRTTTSSPA